MIAPILNTVSTNKKESFQDEVAQMLGNAKLINQRGKTWKIRKGEQLFLYTIHRPDLIYIPIK